MKIKFLLFWLFISVISFAQNTTKIKGLVKDKENNQPLGFVSVSLKGTGYKTDTDVNGNYELNAKPGNFTLVFSFVGYKSIEKSITLNSGQTLEVNTSLQENSSKIEEVVVKVSLKKTTETALLKEQQKAVEIKQSIGAQEMSRKGISDVEEGLTKISGITKVDSRGIFVRGLEGRYTNLLINGLAAPTNNPFNKMIPLDLIPSDVVDQIDTYKTFSPNIYGDFAGATFNVQTTTKITKPITKISIGTGFVTNNNLKDFYYSKNSQKGAGYFGFESIYRDLPSVFGSQPKSISISGTRAQNIFDNSVSPTKGKSPLNSSYGILHGDKFDIGTSKLSYLFALNFDNSYQYREGVRRTFQPGQYAQFSNNLYKQSYSYKTNSSAILGLNYSSNRLNLSTNFLYLKSSSSEISTSVGVLNAQTNTPNAFVGVNKYEQTDFYSGQLFGDYKLTSNGNHKIKVGVSAAKTKFGLPDLNSFYGIKNSNNTISYNYGANNFLRQYLTIDNTLYMSGFAEYSYDFGNDNKLTIGVNGNGNQLESSYRFLNLNPNTNYSIYTLAYEDINDQILYDLNNPDLNQRLFYIEQSAYNWKAKVKDNTIGTYANLNYNITEKLNANIGLRFEQFDLTSYYKDGSASNEFKKVNNTKSYILPALNLKYVVNDKSNLRFASSLTYTKPVSMEAYPIQIVDPEGETIQGNSFLKNSQNTNIDLKYEIFPTNKEMFSLSAFGKRIENPIEKIYIASAGGPMISYTNSKDAILYGIEGEMIFDFGRISKSLSNFSLGFNGTLMQTKVTLADKIINPINGQLLDNIENVYQKGQRTRNLQGASNWLINSDLKYQFNVNKKWNSTVTAVYNVFGKRIYSVGSNGFDHIYEMPVQKLDLVWTNKINEHFDLKFSADNILNPKVRLELGDESSSNFIENSKTYKDFKRGVGFSVGLNYTF